MDYYNRDGMLIDLEEYCWLQQDPEYCCVRRDDVLTPDGRMMYVSTVWLGLNHAPWGPPQIFETMVFVQGMDDEYTRRYSQEHHALLGHASIVGQLQRGLAITDLA